MKLSSIMESDHLDQGDILEDWDQSYADNIANRGSADNLVITSLMKVRNMLYPMGILKNADPEKLPEDNTIKEPIGDPDVYKAFETLRQVVRRKTKQLAADIKAGRKNIEYINKYWGFMVPKNWHDAHAGHMGKEIAQSKFDTMIDNVVDKAKKVPNDEKGLRYKANLLMDLAKAINQ